MRYESQMKMGTKYKEFERTEVSVSHAEAGDTDKEQFEEFILLGNLARS